MRMQFVTLDVFTRTRLAGNPLGLFGLVAVTLIVLSAVFANWLAAVPIVVLGAPLGAVVVHYISRTYTLLVVSTLCLPNPPRQGARERTVHSSSQLRKSYRWCSGLSDSSAASNLRRSPACTRH